MYAEGMNKSWELPLLYQCQDCQGNFGATDSARNCPYCASGGRGNLVILYMEEDEDAAEVLRLVDFAAGD